jgi:hypothetical protein
MASDKKKKHTHECPKIDKVAWPVKITGPAYRDGQSVEEAKAAWFAYLRVLAASCRPMPRRTH